MATALPAPSATYHTGPEEQPGSEADYAAILNAVRETARGRWFLEEFARRNRNADTEVLLTALERIESGLAAAKAAPVVREAPSARPGTAPRIEHHAPAAPDLPAAAPERPLTAKRPRKAFDFASLGFEEKMALFS